MELEHPTEPFEPPRDDRPPMPEPPPVQIVAIADVRLPTIAGLQAELDALYVGLLKFEIDAEARTAGVIAYHAERHRVVFETREVPPAREDYRPLQVLTPAFADVAAALIERQVAFEWQRGVSPGVEALLLKDPAGNWVSIAPLRPVR